MTDDKIQLSHPEGKNAPVISKDKYDLLEQAIVAVLKAHKQLSHASLTKEVRDYFIKHKIEFEGSVDWFGEWVKLHLIAKGIIKIHVEKGKKLNLLDTLILKK